jgi:hypothetical protein
MLRKLILLLIASTVARKLYGQRQASRRTPFPTSSRPPEGY